MAKAKSDKAAPAKDSAAADIPADTPPSGAPPSDAMLKDAVLDAALPDAAFDGFSDAVLTKAGKAAGLDKATLARLFPDGPLSLIAHFSHRADARMEETLAGLALSQMKVRARIKAAVLARLAALKPHKEAARRAGATLALPLHAGLAAQLMWRTVDTMWRAAGDRSTDFNFYTKRAILAGVYGATLVRWFNDTSADEKPTEDFLAARIENVMQFEKFKAEAKKSLAPLADWLKAKPKPQ